VVADAGKYTQGGGMMSAVVESFSPDMVQRALVDGLRACLARGQRVLTVGSPPGTFEDRLHRHPRLLFWPTSEASSRDATRVIPPEVGAVLMTTMLSHDLSRNVRSQVKARGLLMPSSTMSPGGAKRALLACIADETVVPPPFTREEDPMPAQLATPDTPSATPKPTDAASLMRLIDETMAGLQLIREVAAGLVAEVEGVKEQAATLKMLKELLK
jgi:hypothetical protein